MFRRNIVALLKNKVFFLIVLLLFFLNGVYIYKSAVDEYNNVHIYEEVMEWLDVQDDSIEAFDTYRKEIIENYEQIKFTNSLYNEYILLGEVEDYVKGVGNYKNTIENLMEDIENRTQFSFLNQTNSSEKSARVTKEVYMELSDVRPVEGNYFSIEKFMTVGVGDGIVFLIIVAACSFLLIEEREKGMYQLIKTTKKGRVPYYFWKMLSLIVIALISALLLYLFSFILYVVIYGCDSLLQPIQSVPGYLLSPYKINIAQALMQFILFKTLAFVAIAVIVIFICLLPVKASIAYLLNLFIMVISVTMYLGIPRSSKYVIFKYSNFFSMLDVGNYTKSLNYFPFASYEIPLLAFNLLLILVFFVISVLLGLLAYLAYKKTKLIKIKSKKRITLFNKNVLSNEFVRFFFLQGGFVLLLIYLVSTIYVHDFNEVKIETNQYLKNFIEMLNDMEKEEASSWIDNKLIELDELEMEAISLEELYKEDDISEDAYRQGINFVTEQLRIRPVILMLEEQSQYISRVWEEKGIACDYFYEPLYEDAFGESGRADRYMSGMIIALFAVCLIVPSFAYDNQYNMDRLLLVAKKGTNQLVKSRIFISFVLGAFLVILMKIIWIMSLDSRHGISGLSSSLQSIPWFETFPFTITVGGFLVFQSIVEIILMLFICLFLIALSMRGKEVVQSLLYGMIFVVCPVVLGLLSFRPATKYWLTPFFVSDTLFVDGNMATYINVLVGILGIVSIYILSSNKWRGRYGIKY